MRVLERTDNQPIVGAKVLFFVPGADQALERIDVDSSVGQTDSSGQFSAVFLFNTYSGWWLTDRCGARLSRLEVIVAPGDRPAERFFLHGLKSASTKLPADSRLEPLTLQLYPAHGWKPEIK